MDASIITVQAQYSFKGSNNDELCFKKGDIITLTQREEGGWWEGTLGDKTGWFPSNYVKEYAGPLPLSETIRPPEEIQAFRSVVFRDLLESEKAHVAELRGLAENFLEPLEGSQILAANEYTQLMCNFLEVVEMHEEFLQTLEDCNDRVGKVFLSKAPTMKKIHQFYCAAHPRAIVIVDKFREELNVFMEKQGAAKPGLLVLTTGLSKPFRRLDKYAAILQELERHMESGHPDRGDTQRSIAVYKDIASSCSATRRQKELELQILTGPVRGWQGAELSTLGDIIHMGSVAVGPEHKDRYLVLFPQTLLILSVSQRMSAFKYEGKLPLTGITVNRLEDTDQIKNAFEISGTLIDRIVAVCQGPNEANRWVELLSPKSGAIEQNSSAGAVDMKRNVSSSAVNIPQPPPHMSPPSATGNSHPSRSGTSSIVQHMSQHKRSQSFNHHLSYNQVQQQQQQLQQQQLKQHPPNPSLLASPNSLNLNRHEANQAAPNQKGFSEKVNWNITNLRPAPPLRPAFLSSVAVSSAGGGAAGGGSGGGRSATASITGSIGGAAVSCVGGGSNSNSGGSSSGLNASDSVHHCLSFSSSSKVSPTYEEDALVLRVIEAYCAAYQSTSRNTMHSEIRSLSGEPDYKSVNLTWEVESVHGEEERPVGYKGRMGKHATSPMSTVRGPRSFNVFYCELQNWGPHRCRSKIVTDESGDSGKSKQYSLLVKNLRMATKYSFHVKPQAKKSEQRASGRADDGEEDDQNAATTAINQGQTIIIPTKGFSAHATQCLPDASEIEVETGPYFGGRIAAENGNCGIQGDVSSPQESYTMRIDHDKCGSKVSTRDLTVETYITVQENLGILTHSTRRFVVVCTFQPDTLTVRARLALPGKGGAAPVPTSEWWPATGRNARVRQFNMVDKSSLVLKGTEDDEPPHNGVEQQQPQEEDDTGVPAEVRELPAVEADSQKKASTGSSSVEKSEDKSSKSASNYARLLNEQRTEPDEGAGLIDELDEYGQDLSAENDALGAMGEGTDGTGRRVAIGANSQRRSSGGSSTAGGGAFDATGLLISACLAVILIGALVYLLQREFKKQRMIHQHQQMERTASERRGAVGVTM
ncbi:uncharacterized protein LOC126563961 isoform X1 [Anopheles maculipalpis]|uniref:uncharacterized protein LOC126563961 isoform X1 n=1 Tax=Anopheles maculipalpis TaxID=1496333 RepID=UPI0021599F5D|nr:uncharacterized protein LOC126563961 isoform X1 [Anopheles maculipalpis]